ncbi:MAG: aminopeptidase [Chitinivibrionales bacterium]|nr:aminopeptidase [Chitinivibrionales bacterium]
MNLRRTAIVAGIAALLMTVLIVFDGCYLVKQGCYLAADHMRAKPVRKVLAHTQDPALDSFLTAAQAIKAFAVDSLGLADDRNYTTYVETDRSYMVDVVSAARADSFEQHQWCYPIVGCVPYKGFYDPDDARTLADRLREDGLDVYQWHAGAFSTLGILTDPLYTYMRKYSLFDLASLIVHEQTHATLYLRGQAQFNEELATFVGTEGGLAFVAATLGDTSAEYRNARAQLRDKHTFREFIERLYARLDSLYSLDIPTETKLERKRALITESQQHFAHTYDEHFETDRYRGFAESDVNNAYLCVHATYNEELELYYRVYEQYGEKLKPTIAALLGAEESSLEPKEYVQSLIEPGPGEGELRRVDEGGALDSGGFEEPVSE